MIVNKKNRKSRNNQCHTQYVPTKWPVPLNTGLYTKRRQSARILIYKFYYFMGDSIDLSISQHSFFCIQARFKTSWVRTRSCWGSLWGTTWLAAQVTRCGSRVSDPVWSGILLLKLYPEKFESRIRIHGKTPDPKPWWQGNRSLIL